MTTPAMPAPAQDPFAERMPPARMLLDTRGRVGRRDFWLWGLALPAGLGLLLGALAGIARLPVEETGRVVNLLLLWPTFAVTAKRWHDRDRSAWWTLLWLVPVLGWIWTLVACGLLRGTRGPNRHGPDPLAEA